MNNLSKKTRVKLMKAFTFVTAAATIFSLSGFLYLATPGFASAASPSDFGLKEGDLISAAGSDDPDVYIVNDWGFKRLFLNPVIFGFYGHLGGFQNVKNVSSSTRDAFPTSGLFRLDGDEKVYGVETTGEDVGVLHWVNTSGAQAVADDPDFFKKVFVINQNEFNWYPKGSDFTSVSQVPDYSRQPGATPTSSPTPTPTGALSVSLAPGNPSAATVTTNAQGVEFLRARFSGTGTVDSVTIKRSGAGATGDFSNVYLYEGARRLVAGRTLSSSTGEVTFSNLGWSVSGSRDLSVVGDLSSASAGNVHRFELSSVSLSSGSVSGLPLGGSNFSVSGASSGTLTLAKVGSLGNPNAGQTNVQLSEFKLSANTEAASVKRIQMIQGGDVKPSDLTNLKLKAGSSEWSGTINSAGEMVFDLGSGFTIAKGGNAVFKVFGDVAGKKSETVKLYFEYATDILAMGDQFGFGMAATVTALDTAAEAHALTLQGGVLTATFVGPTASDIGTDTDDTTFLRFTLAAASNVEIRKTRLNLSLDLAGDGTYDDLGSASVSSGFADLDDIKIVNEDTGAVLAGPVDGSSFTTDSTDGNPSGTSAAQHAFTDVIDLSAGQVLKAKVTADVKKANTRTGTDIEVNSVVAISLADYSDNTGLTELKYTGTNTALAVGDIVPNAHIAGPNMTVKASTLTLGLSSNPQDQTIVKGSQNIDSVGITFAASNASSMKVTDVTLTGYSDADGSGAFDKGSAGDIASMVSTVSLYEKESGALLSSTPSSNNLNSTAGTVVFNNLNWTIPAGSTKTLLVRVNLLNLDRPTKFHFGFDIAATTDVTALDDSNTMVNAGNATPNGATSITTDVTVTNAGNIFVTEDESSPSKQKNSLYWNQTGVEVSHFKVRTTNEGFFIDRFNLTSADGTDAKNNVKNVYLSYQDESGNWLTTSGQPLSADSTPSVSFGFSGSTRPYIPKDSSRVVKVLIDLVETHQAGATSNVDFALNFSGGAADEFESTGEGSLSKVKGNDTTGDDTDSVTVSNKVLVYRSFPKFAAVSMSNGATSGQAVVGKFDITAMGYDVLFGTTANASGSLIFDTLSSGSGTPSFTATLYDDATNQSLDTVAVSNAATNASISFQQFTNAFSILAGTTKRVRVEANLSGYTTPVNTSNGIGADFFQLILQDEVNVVKWVDSAGANADSDQANTAGYLDTLPAYGPYLTGQ